MEISFNAPAKRVIIFKDTAILHIILTTISTKTWQYPGLRLLLLIKIASAAGRNTKWRREKKRRKNYISARGFTNKKINFLFY